VAIAAADGGGVRSGTSSTRLAERIGGSMPQGGVDRGIDV
jgi:hypothetical protein